MANYTTNFNLKKPLKSEPFTVTDANGNMDLIDAHVHSNATGAVAGFMSATDKSKLDAIGVTITTNTWTPVISGTSTAGTGTYSYQTGYYTKIGNLVFVNAAVNITNHTGTGNIIISLPFASNTTANFYQTLAFYSNALTLPAGHVVYAQIDPNTSYINVMSSATGSTSLAYVAMDTACSFRISGCYVAQ